MQAGDWSTAAAWFCLLLIGWECDGLTLNWVTWVHWHSTTLVCVALLYQPVCLWKDFLRRNTCLLSPEAGISITSFFFCRAEFDLISSQSAGQHLRSHSKFCLTWTFSRGCHGPPSDRSLRPRHWRAQRWPLKHEKPHKPAHKTARWHMCSTSGQPKELLSL